MRPTDKDSSTTTALEAYQRGYTPVPIMTGQKKPYGVSWQHLRWESAEQVKTSFDKWAGEGASGIGLHCGEASSNLVDIDLDHPKTLRLRDHFLPPSPMETGRSARPQSHRWFVATGKLPITRKYKMPDGSMAVELRSSGAQTVIPPSIHPENDEYRWEGEPWGGGNGPAEIDGHKLAIQVALLALGAVLLDAWPQEGSRHEAYLALAGGLLRYGDGVHPFWERNLHVLIGALADASHDNDGAETRVTEVMGTTLGKLREGGRVSGFPTLAEHIGVDHAEQARRLAREVESLGGFVAGGSAAAPPAPLSGPLAVHDDRADGELPSTLPPEFRNPLEERVSTWDRVDLGPYLSGQIVMPEPSVLVREDGKGLFYPGRVNSLFGMSESAKSWISLISCVQEMAKGERVVYLDLEDEPAGTIKRIRALGASDEDIENLFLYVRPESPLAEMQRGKFGSNSTADGEQSSERFKTMLADYDPTVIIADGMTVLYGLHGHDTNDAMATDVITSWLKTLTRGGRSTVIVIDHTGKSGGAGSSPLGAHHKVAMVQGTALRADPVQQPMPGEIGTVRLIVFKDRPGVVRANSSKDAEQVAGLVTLDSTVDGITRFRIEPPTPGDFVVGDSNDMEAELERIARVGAVRDLVFSMFDGELGKYLTTTEVVLAHDIPRPEVLTAWQVMEVDGDVVREGERRHTKFRLTDPKESNRGGRA